MPPFAESILANVAPLQPQVKLLLLRFITLIWRQRIFSLASTSIGCGLWLTWKWWRLCCDWQRRSLLVISSPLYGSTAKLAVPSAQTIPDKWWGFCSSCKRPLDARLCEQYPPPPCDAGIRGQYAYVITIWGSSREYVLGALVLGQSLKNTGSRHARVCLYTGDVPQAYVALLSRVWQCRIVEHVKRSDVLCFKDQCSRFEKVFTKLRVLGLTDFEKVLLLDIDLMIMHNIDELFDLAAPAAMRRGMNDGFYLYKHGDLIDGRSFFLGAESKPWTWGQGTGINAGVMLLQPDANLLEEMMHEIADSNHPSHIKANGPEQDYLSRYWADRWRHISVEYNFQLHQMFFALQPDRVQTVERAFMVKTPNRIKVVHFSGNHETAKPWHRILDSRFAAYWPSRDRDDDYVERFAGEFAGYWLWVKKDRHMWASMHRADREKVGRLDYDVNGMYLDDGEIYRRAGKDSSKREHVEIPSDVVEGSMHVLKKALSMWFDTFEDLEEELGFGIAAALQEPGDVVATTVAGRGNSNGVVAPPSTSGLRWRRPPGGWWEQHGDEGSTGKKTIPENCDATPKVSACCSAVPSNPFVKFMEAGVVTFEDADEELTGVFVKVAGCHSARHFFLSPSNGVDEALTSLCLWVDSVPLGEPVMLVMIRLDRDTLQKVLEALAPLGVPQDTKVLGCQAFAAVGLRAETNDEGNTASSWTACHASHDLAFASMSLK